MTSAPGTMVNMPAAASSPQSRPVADTVRVMTAAMGLAAVGGEGARHEELDPGEHEAEKRGDADAGLDQRHEHGREEAWQRIAVDIGHLVDLARHG